MRAATLINRLRSRVDRLARKRPEERQAGPSLEWWLSFLAAIQQDDDSPPPPPRDDGPDEVEQRIAAALEASLQTTPPRLPCGLRELRPDERLVTSEGEQERAD